MKDKFFDYGEYEKLFAHKDFKRAIKAIREVSEHTGIDYAVVGGGAVYLHTHNPPEDEPDLDVLLDADMTGADTFVRALKKRRLTVALFDYNLVTRDAFAIMVCGEVQVDIFTDQTERQYARGAITEQLIRIKPIEPLIIEKLFRANYEDLLAAADLLATRKCDFSVLFQLAQSRYCSLLLMKLRHLVEGFADGVLTKAAVKKAIKRLSEGGKL